MNKNKSEFVMLAHNYDPRKHRVNSWYVSEKLDGIRCLWDGGVTRGLRAFEVPWANTEKHGRFLTETYATGLWSRYGQPIQAPAWWLDLLPKIVLDGELTMGRNTWQELSSCIRNRVPDSRWDKVQYAIFDSPPIQSLLEDRKINGVNFKKKLVDCLAWYKEQATRKGFTILIGDSQPFYKTYAMLQDLALPSNAYALAQVKIDSRIPVSITDVEALLKSTELQGGEGLIARSPCSVWSPMRSYDLLKIKSTHDAEGTVVGYKWAEPTDMDKSLTGNQTDKLLGLMGSLRLRAKGGGGYFNLSGFKDVEREMRQVGVIDSINSREIAKAAGVANPGKEVDTNLFENALFPIGSQVTYKYRELSDGGIPKEARYLRKKEL